MIERVGKPQLRSDGTIEIRLVARIQKDYGGKDWRFSNEARLQTSALTGGFLAAGIELIFDPVNGYNLIGHDFRIAPAKQSVDDATEAVRDLSRSIQRTFDQLNAPAENLSVGPETKLDRLLETWRVVAERLGNELDRSDGDSLIAKSRLLVIETGNFFRSSDKRFDEVHDDLRDVFGETPSERRALRRKANELLDSADALTSRVGDTFIGRLLIRSEQRKAKEAERLKDYSHRRRNGNRAPVGKLPRAVELAHPLSLRSWPWNLGRGVIAGTAQGLKLSLKLIRSFHSTPLLSGIGAVERLTDVQASLVLLPRKICLPLLLRHLRRVAPGFAPELSATRRCQAHD